MNTWRVPGAGLGVGIGPERGKPCLCPRVPTGQCPQKSTSGPATVTQRVVQQRRCRGLLDSEPARKVSPRGQIQQGEGQVPGQVSRSETTSRGESAKDHFLMYEFSYVKILTKSY